MKAEAIAKSLGGRRAGGGWLVRCPAHDDREPSLSVRNADNGKVLVRCHAGCDQGRVIAVLRSRGLWEVNGRASSTRAGSPVDATTQPDRDEAKRTEAALAIWQAATLADGTPAKTYLVSRGLRLSPPPTLRFHFGLKHPTGGIWPAMVSLVTRGPNDEPLAIHRTFLTRDGNGKAPVEPQKMMLGPCRGGAVRLGVPSDVLLVGEGIETCLSGMLASGYPAWAALSASGLRALDLPPDVREVIVLADGDEPGEAAARECAWRWSREGRRVRIARPPRGFDFNDVLRGRTFRPVADAA
jgi:hypothetical protein